MSPKQKAEVVQLIKDRQPDTITLAIGDGANDVNMISTAHIGIGILGHEGNQAAKASDYAISQFSFLNRLLFVHGRESLRRNSFIVIFIIYKNVMLIMPQFLFGFICSFSAQGIYDEFLYQFYNLFLTSLPIIWYGIQDKEVKYTLLENEPKYYLQGINGKYLNNVRFWKWVIFGMSQGAIIFFFIIIKNTSPKNYGKMSDFITDGK